GTAKHHVKLMFSRKGSEAYVMMMIASNIDLDTNSRPSVDFLRVSLNLRIFYSQEKLKNRVFLRSYLISENNYNARVEKYFAVIFRNSFKNIKEILYCQE
ncbi:hypothetical protein ACJX0J_010657, partial [Zea mays]